MFPTRLLRSSAFRLALGYGSLFALSALALLAFVYWATASFMQQQTDETIEAEIQGLAERYRLTGLAGLTSSIRERIERRPQGSSIYLLTDGTYGPIVGNLSRWPAAATEPDPSGFVDFELAPQGGEPAHRARAKPFLLRGGFYLLVGRDLHELQEVRSLLLRTMGWGAALTLGLAAVGGAVASRSRLRRIAIINEAIGAVMAGDLARRIPEERRRDDIEELVERVNRMLDELEKLVEGVRRVSDSIAHDLRTPLARLKTRLERLKRAETDADGEVEKAVAEADRLLATFGALLRIARIESGETGRGAFREVDLTALIDDVVDLYGPLIEEAGKKLVLHVAPEVNARGDRDMLFQAVVNVVDNALKHTPPGGRVEIALGASGRNVEIAIADDGPGIPEEERSKVRERFYRLDRSRTTAGAGLGLSLVAAVVEHHRGTLRFEDAGPGLRVVISLPAPG